MPRSELNTRITAQDRTRAAFSSVDRQLNALRGGVLGLGRVAGGTAAALAGIGTVALLGLRRLDQKIQETVNYLDEIDKASRAAGIDPETLQSWRLFGELGGAAAGQVDTSLRRIRRRLGEAQLGGEVARSFDILGVSVRNANGELRTLEEVTPDLVNALAQADNTTTAFAAAVRIGDIEFARLAQAFIDNGGQVDQLFAKFRELGIILDSEVVDAAVKVKDEVTLLNAQLDAQEKLLTAGLLPGWLNFRTVINDLVIGAVDLAQAVGNALTGNVSTRDIDRLQTEYADAVKSVEELGDELERVRDSTISPRQKRRELRELESALNAAKDRANEAAGALIALGVDVTGFDFEAFQRVTGALAQGPGTGDTSVDQRVIDRLNQRLNIAKGLTQQDMIRLEIAKAGTEQEREILRAIIAALDAKEEAVRLAKEQEEAEKALAETAEEVAATAVRNAQLEREKREAIQDQLNLYLFIGSLTQEQFEELSRTIGAWENIGQAVEDVADTVDGMWEVPPGTFLQIRDDLNFAFEDGISAGIQASISSGDWNDLFDYIGRSLLDTVTRSLLDTIFSSIGGGGGIFGSLFGGFRQRGGGVRPGQFYVVGERGPEILLPDISGTVIPNSATGGLTLNVTNQNTVNGSDLSREELLLVLEQSNASLEAKIYRAANQGRLTNRR